MAQVKLKITENKNSLAEIGHGANEVEMAFINEDTGENVSQIVKCKDFFQDIFWSRAKKSSSSIYGFSWSHDKNNEVFSRKWLTIFARIKTVKDHNLTTITKEQVKNLKIFLNEFCKALKIPLCTTTLDSTEKYVVVKFNSKWTTIPYLLSGFFLYVRLGLTYDGERDIVEYISKDSNKFLSTNDPIYVKSAMQKIKDMLEGKLDTKQTYDSYINISDVHNNSGIVNYKKDYKVD